MRVAVADVLVQQQRAALAQPLDDARVGLVYLESRKRPAAAQPVALVEASGVVDGHDHVDAELAPGQVVVCAVPGRRVHDARAVVERDVIRVDEAARAPGIAEDGLLVDVARKLLARAPPRGAEAVFHQRVLPAELLAAALGQRLGKDDRTPLVLDGHVAGLGLQDYGLVGRQGPRRGGPDSHVGSVREGLQPVWRALQFETHVDGGADLVGVLQLGLGQRRVAVRAPVDGLAAAIDCAGKVHLLEDLDVARLVFRGKGEVGVVPLARHAQALEAHTLPIQLLFGVFAADAAKDSCIYLGHLLRAQLVFHLVLDGQAMTVPTGHVGRKIPAHAAVLYDDVLQDFVQRVPDVNRTIGIGRAVVQNEGLGAFVALQHLVVQVELLPALQALGLVLRQPRLHLEGGARQVHRVFVIRLFLRHLLSLRKVRVSKRIAAAGIRASARGAHAGLLPRKGRGATASPFPGAWKYAWSASRRGWTARSWA